MDSLNALSAFVYAAEMRSFTDAGKQLNLSPSAVGKAIARLEARHGVRLFNRNTRTMTLTQEGQLFLDSCRTIFFELNKVEQEFASNKAAPKGKLRVKFPLLGTFMVPCLSRFMEAYPDLSLEVDFTDHSVDVIDGGYDVVIQTGEAPDSRLISRTIGKYRFAIVGSPDYLYRAGIPKTRDDLTSHECFHRKCLATGKLERWPIANSGPDDTLTSNKWVTSAFDPLIALAELGAGLVCVPDILVKQQVAAGSLVPVLDDQAMQTETIRAVWPSNRYTSPKLRAFVDYLSQNWLSREPLRGAAKSNDEVSPKPQARTLQFKATNRNTRTPPLLLAAGS